jgi:hypothetical protein
MQTMWRKPVWPAEQHPSGRSTQFEVVVSMRLDLDESFANLRMTQEVVDENMRISEVVTNLAED